MIAILALMACGPRWDDLASPKAAVQAAAIRDLTPHQARALVPSLEKWAVLPNEDRSTVVIESLEALLRADTERSAAFVASYAAHERGGYGVQALGSVQTKRACDTLARLCFGAGPWQGEDAACRPLASADLTWGWACWRSAEPWRAESPAAEALCARMQSR